MTDFKKFKPTGWVNLREWPAGRANQLKLMLGHLEKVANTSLAAQVRQSGKRLFDETVPKIVEQDIEVEIEFREIRIRFEPPKGMRRFLFYEFQLSLTEVIANIEREDVSPEPSFVFSNLLDAEEYFIRVRVVTTDGHVGPWSDVLAGTTPSARIISQKATGETNIAVSSTTFATLYTFNLVGAINATIFYLLDYEFSSVNSSGADFYWSDVEFRWMFDGAQQGQYFTMTAFNKTLAATGTGTLGAVTFPGMSYMRCGTFIQKPHDVTSGDHVITLEGRLINPHPTPNDLTFSVPPSYGTNANLQFRNFSIFIVNQGAVS